MPGVLEVDEPYKASVRAAFEGRLLDGTDFPLPDPHICCFATAGSEAGIPHWALYGRSGAGLVLVLDGKALSGSKLDLVPVIYDVAQQRRLREPDPSVKFGVEAVGPILRSTSTSPWRSASARSPCEASRSDGGALLRTTLAGLLVDQVLVGLQRFAGQSMLRGDNLDDPLVAPFDEEPRERSRQARPDKPSEQQPEIEPPAEPGRHQRPGDRKRPRLLLVAQASNLTHGRQLSRPRLINLAEPPHRTIIWPGSSDGERGMGAKAVGSPRLADHVALEFASLRRVYEVSGGIVRFQGHGGRPWGSRTCCAWAKCGTPIDLIGECRDLGNDPARWFPRMLEGLSRLVGSPVTGGEGLAPRTDCPVIPLSAFDSGMTPADRTILGAYMRDGGPTADPLFARLEYVPGKTFTRTRRQLIEDADYHRSSVYDRYFRVGMVEHRLVSVHRRSAERSFSALCFHRAPRERDFSPREQGLLTSFTKSWGRWWGAHW